MQRAIQHPPQRPTTAPRPPAPAPGAAPAGIPPQAAGRSPGTPSGTNWLFGVHPVAAALANPARRLRRLLATPEGAQALARIAAAAGTVPRLAAEPAERGDLDRLLPPGAVHQGVALLADPLVEPDLDDLLAGLAADAAAIFLVLDQVTDPHNVGAILRSAAAFGVAALVMQDRYSPPATGTLAKAASGALERVALVRVVNVARALDALGEAGFLRLGLAEEADAPLVAGRPAARVALALGSEGEGLRRLTRERCDRLARLPTDPAFPSLNVSNAAAIALFALSARPAMP